MNQLYLYVLIVFIFVIILLLGIYFYNIKCENFKTKSKIPKNVYLTHKNDIDSNIIKNIKNLNPGYNVYFYNNEDCKNFFIKEYSNKPEYLKFINKLEKNKIGGPILADFWRVAILYKYGGIYLDSDIYLVKNFDYFIEKDTDFLTSKGWSWTPDYILNNKNNLNPHIIACSKNDKILKQCLIKYEKLFNSNFNYSKMSIVNIMHDSFNKLKLFNSKNKNYKIQLLESNTDIITKIESNLNFDIRTLTYNSDKIYTKYNEYIIFYNSNQNYDSLNHKY